MKQIKILALAILFHSTLFAADGIRFETLKWAQIKAKALKEHKMIFLDAFASWCGPCKYMEENIYSDKKTADYFNENYINVKIDMEIGEGPTLSEEFNVSAYPTFLFFTPEGKLVHKSVGALEIDEFIELGKKARQPDQQYFTLKNKAKTGLLDDASFLRWVEQADKLEDDDKDELVKKYVVNKKDIFANKDILNIVINYSIKSDTRVALLLKERVKISTLMKWDSATANLELYNMVFSHALKSYLKNNSSVDSFMATFGRVYPAQIELARADLKYRIALFVKSDAPGTMDLFIGYLNETKNDVPVQTIFRWMIDNFDKFEKAEFIKLDSALQTYKLRPGDADQECWIYMMQILAAVKMEDAVKAKEFANKAYHHKNLPEFYKQDLKTNYDLK